MDEPQGDDQRLGCFTFLHGIAGCLVVSATIVHTHGSSFGRSLAVIIGVTVGILFYFAVDILDWRISRHLLMREDHEKHPLRESEMGRLGFIMTMLAVVWCVVGFELGEVVARACSTITIGHT